MDGQQKTVAIIELGSTGIRLLVAEISRDGTWRQLDRAGKPLSLGRDVFTTGVITRESLLACLSVLKGFQELIAGWAIRPEDVHLIGTSALREAQNRDTFIDRVFLQTGFRVTVLEGIEETRLMYLAVRQVLKNVRPQFFRANSIILEVGGGSTELMLLRGGKMAAAHSLRLGTILIGQHIQQLAMSSSSQMRQLIEEQVRATCEALHDEMDLKKVTHFIVADSDARIMAAHLGKELSKDVLLIPRASFIEFAQEIGTGTVEECVQKLRIPFAEAESLMPGFLTYSYFLEKTAAKELLVPNVSIREGMLITLASGVDSALQEEFYSQIVASAKNLGNKYHYDEAHSLHVAHLALFLFDELQAEHGLDRRARLYLELAGILHDIGAYVSSSGHHKHSQYLVANSEVFGLRREDLDIISNIVRYHRKSQPNSSHISYISLQREERMLVQKLAALLRVADALDRSHAQHIKTLTIQKRADTIVLRTSGLNDISLERLGLKEKADMFKDIFGAQVVLI